MRDCENCIRNIPGQGCTSWDCEYINRKEAIEIYEAYKNIVPCRECKYAKFKIEEAKYVKCMITQLFVNKSDFCPDGERRSE